MTYWGFMERLDRAWGKADPRLLWRPCDDIDQVLKAIARRRPVRYDEAVRITESMMYRRASGGGAESVKRAVLGQWSHPDEFLWKGRIRGRRSWAQPWEELEREARADGRQFCLIAKHRVEVLDRIYRRERELDELRRLTNKLQRTITDRRRAERMTAT